MLFEHACEQALGAYFRQEDTVGVRFREWSACQNLARNELKQVGWTKGLELAKVARRDRERFDCATWLHQGSGNAEGRVQAGSREGANGKGRTTRDHLLQGVQEPEGSR